jgi:hypothetical protein
MILGQSSGIGHRIESAMLDFDQGSQKEVYKSKVMFKAVRNKVGTKAVLEERV